MFHNTANYIIPRTCKHLHELGAHCTEEGHASLASNGTGQVRLACAGRPLEDDALQARSNMVKHG